MSMDMSTKPEPPTFCISSVRLLPRGKIEVVLESVQAVGIDTIEKLHERTSAGSGWLFRLEEWEPSEEERPAWELAKKIVRKEPKP